MNKSVQTFFKKILWFLWIPFFIAFVNYWVDPAHIFSEGSYEKRIAQNLVEGSNVSHISNYDDRLLQKLYAQNLKEKKQVLVFGSSRSMQIRSELFQGKTFYNASVTGASLQDYLSLFFLFQKQSSPDILVLGVDPWVLNTNNEQNHWKTLAPEYNQMLEQLGISDRENFSYIKIQNTVSRFSSLFSPSYFQTSFTLFVKEIFGQTHHNDVSTTEKSEDDDMIKRNDGSLQYDAAFRLQSVEQVKKSAENFASTRPIYSLGDFSQMDPELIKNFEKFIIFLQEKKIQVILFLPPYHPFVYDTLAQSEDYKKVREVEMYFNTFAQEHTISIVGSYNPEKAGLDEADFFDGMHPKESGIQKIFRGYDSQFSSREQGR